MAMKETKSDPQYDPVVRTRIDFIWNNLYTFFYLAHTA